MCISLVPNRRLVAACLAFVTALAIPRCRAAERPSTADLVKAAASSGAPMKRYTAIDDLGERHEDASQAVPTLVKMLQDRDPQIRWRTARTLGEYGALAKDA